ncbi:MAG: ATP-binding protein, partial [Thermotaleaceae bacterium]
FPTVFLFSAITGISITDITSDPLQKLVLSIMVKGTQLIIVYVLIRSDKAFVRILSNEEKNNIIPYFLFGICLMSIFVFNINYAIDSGENIFIYELLLLAILLLYVFLGFKIIQEKEQLLKIQHKYNLQEAYVKNIETILNIIRREKHDFANHINTIHAICTLNRPDALDKIKAYIDRVTHNLQSAYRYYNTGNDYVDGLLAVKSNYAFDHNIHFEVDFEALLENTSVDSYDLISILGNIIDNAFEALNQQIDLEQKIVSVSAYEEKDRYYLSIANNGPIIPKEKIDLIFSNGYSTKEVDKHDHGLGLFIVKQLILKNNGNVVVTSTEEETEFLICFDRWKGKNGEISTESYELNSL